jgi:RHS repeat-associated protein
MHAYDMRVVWERALALDVKKIWRSVLLVLAAPFFIPAAFAQINVAAQANGGTATASTAYYTISFDTTTYTFAPDGAIDGDRKGLKWGAGGGWNDSTPGAFPDWLQVNFSRVQTIGEIDVFTVQDNYTAPTEPTASMTFTRYGITQFQVKYWDGSSWVDVPGASVSDNNLVWRRFTFEPITTDRIRVIVNAAIDSYSRIVEVEAWTVDAPSAIALNAPLNNAMLSAPATVSLSATSGISVENVGKVEFYRDGTLIGTATSAASGAYGFIDKDVGVGSYSYTAKLYDNAAPARVSQSSTRLVTVTAVPAGAANVAAQANAGTVSASSAFSGTFGGVAYTFPTSAVNDGDRKGMHWGYGGGWNDSTIGEFPDWLQVNFSGMQTIGEIDVFTVQDDYTAPVEPNSSMTFSRYGITDFQVQYWNGSAWVDVPGGNVTGNKLVWRRFPFAPVTTDRIRVVVNWALESYSRIIEVEAWTAAGGPPKNVAPTIDLTATSNSRATVNLSATAADIDGAVTKVEFYRDDTLIATVTAAVGGVYTHSDGNVGPGTYAYSARVYDNATPAAIATSMIQRVTVSASTDGRRNVAAQANGGTASASSTYNAVGGDSIYTFPASGAIDGDRKGLNWGSGGGWNDATASGFPDWLQVNFSGSQTVDEIDVFTVQDNYTAPVEPTAGMTFTRYGITDFQVQYWNGSAWLDVPGGNIAGNNLVWRRLTFAPITTDRIRVVVNGALETYSRIIEVEAWTAATSSPTSQQQIYFVHTDHLNTPRVITNTAGRAVWRWDNLDPFGANAPDENPSGLGTFTCNLRFPGQYFDREKNLHYNYFRDYDPTVGRYVESDPIGLRGGFNTYMYVEANSLIHSDPTGLRTFKVCGAENGQKFPDNFGAFRFTTACTKHDNCYDDCVKLPTKAECDVQFLDNMQKACREIPIFWRALGAQSECLSYSLQYAIGVELRGKQAFESARAKCPACLR